jgi:hypothetical protein
MKWQAGLAGEDFDLQVMAGTFEDGDPVVRQRPDGSYVVESSSFDSLTELTDVNAEAERLLTLMHGSMSVNDPQVRAVIPSRTFWNEDGQHVLAFAGTAHGRGTARIVSVDAGGNHLPLPPAPARQWFDLGKSNLLVAEALEFLGTPTLGWGTMYKIWELIEEDVEGGFKAIVRHGWASRNEIEVFKRSCNHPEVAGNESRHAVTEAEPPKHPMSLVEARNFIRTLAQRWLQWAASDRPAPR